MLGRNRVQPATASHKWRRSLGDLFSSLKALPAIGGHSRKLSDLDVSQVLAGSANTGLSLAQRHQLLRDIGKHAARMPKAIVPLLQSMAALELMQKPGTHAAANKIIQLLQSDRGRHKLATAAETVAEHFPHSVFVLFIRCVSLAKAGDFETASELVRAAFERFQRVDATGVSPAVGDNDQGTIVQIAQIWRVLDAIARNEMLWSGEEGSGELLLAGRHGSLANAQTGAASVAAGESEHVMLLALAEPLIQSRSQTRYLEWCEGVFKAASSFQSRIEAIRAMIRQGLRPVPTYHDAYDLARSSYAVMRHEVLDCVAAAESDEIGEHEGRSIELVRQLSSALFVVRKLGLEDDRRLIEDVLLRMARLPGQDSIVWTVAASLIASDPVRFGEATRDLVHSAKRLPGRNREVDGFMSWATRADDFDAAHRLYRALPEPLRRCEGLTQYVGLLASRGRFDEAQRLIKGINASLIANPAKISPVRAWSSLRREGEIAFCVDTARIFASVPQPTSPEGVVFILARNVDELRRYPLVVLMELKKRGWAIIPVVSGLLPDEPTGMPAIDRFIGCLDGNGRVRPKANGHIPPVEDFVVDVPRGVLRWGGIDLGHAMWEEAGINRRRFNVDFTCPSLVEFLSRLAGWSESVARVLQSARAEMESMGLPAAVMTLSQSRLPDVLGRQYCETHGDEKTFFCMQVTNGYENYFENFSASVSTRAVLRNMTASPEMRSASFPNPKEFEAWYESNKSKIQTGDQDLFDLERRQQIASSRAGVLADKQACIAEIDEWRAGGGKVVCAFGKLTCDLAAPRDGGPAHQNLKDWLNHTVDCVRDSRTMLLIKPHPHERRPEISTFLTEFFTELIEVELPPNVKILQHDWFSAFEISKIIDLGVVYNGTVSVELGLLDVPTVLCAHYAPVDYPIGHAAPQNREHYRQLVRFETPAVCAQDLRARSIAWIRYMRGDKLAAPYRYHARPITNKIVYPPWWFTEDVDRYLAGGDANITRLAERVIEKRHGELAPHRAATPTPYR